MIANLNTWKISLVNENRNVSKSISDYFKIHHPLSYLLNTNKSDFSIIEKIVYEIAEFHYNRLNMEFDNTKHVEFWLKNNTEVNNFHFDCDEYDKNTNLPDILSTPLLSCVVYFNDNDIPTVITNVNQESKNLQKYTENNTIVLSFPKYLKHITFDGGNNCHGTTKLFETNETRYMLAINLWDKKPSYVPYFDYSIIIYMLYSDTRNFFIKSNISDKIEMTNITKDEKIIDVRLDIKNTKSITLENHEIINPNFFEDICCNNIKYDSLKKIGEMIKEDLKDFDTFVFEFPEKTQNVQINRNVRFNEEIYIFDTKLDKFKQRIIITNMYSAIVCDWIVREYEKYIESNDTKDLIVCVEKLQNVFSFVVETFSSILEKITKSYSLNETEFHYNILDVIIVKNNSNYVECYDKSYDLKVNIALNDDFEGGGFYFEDEITHFLEKSSMIIHNSKTKHSINEIKKGTQYVFQMYIQFMKIN
jgi:hypothetical protein